MITNIPIELSGVCDGNCCVCNLITIVKVNLANIAQNQHSYGEYRIAGCFRGYKISRIVPNLVKTRFSRFLISRSITVTARALARADHFVERLARRARGGVK